MISFIHTIPTFWRYLLGQYLKVLFLGVVAFIAVLMTTRLDDIAHFASMSPSYLYVIKFTLYQIPYMIPIAIPISCLISTTILVQRLCLSHELTAFRSAGMSLHQFLAPILIASGFFALANFYIVSEVATNCHLATNLLKTEVRSVNPLHLARNKHVRKMKGIYFETLGNSRMGETASDAIFAIPNHKNNRMNVMFAKDVEVTRKEFRGEQMTLVTSLTSDPGPQFDRLMIENIQKSNTSVDNFFQILRKQVWKVNHDYLQLPLLLARLKTERQALKENIRLPYEEYKKLKTSTRRIYTEIIRRASIAIAAFTFTLMGASFGMSISRNRSYRGIIFVVALASLYLVCYFIAMGMDHMLPVAGVLYIVPHGVMIAGSIWMLRRVSRGIE